MGERKDSTRVFLRLLMVLGTICLILVGIYALNDRSYYLIAAGILILGFFVLSVSFERRHLQTREVVLLATMSGLAVASRAAFFMLPQVKPVAAIVIITGASLGVEAGFFVGALTAFVSNFIFGQGPWTPWQMLAFGLVGALAGLIFSGNRNGWKNKRVLLCAVGFIETVIVYGLTMDTASAFMMTKQPIWQSMLAFYASGFPFNLVHGVSTVIFLWILGNVMFRKLDRVKRRYGMFR